MLNAEENESFRIRFALSLQGLIKTMGELPAPVSLQPESTAVLIRNARLRNVFPQRPASHHHFQNFCVGFEYHFFFSGKCVIMTRENLNTIP